MNIDDYIKNFEHLQNTPVDITIPKASNPETWGQAITLALKYHFITLFYSPQFHELMDKLRESCDSEKELAPRYREYLIEVTASLPVVRGPGRIIVSRKNRSSDIAKLEEKFYNEHSAGFNPFSGFICHLAGVSEESWGSTLDSLLDPGGP